MTRVVLKCDMECAGVEHKAGEMLEVDDDNLSRMLRKNMAELAAKPAAKKKKKAEPASD